MKYYLPIHLDGGNRGCEAIAKGTAKLLGVAPAEMVSLCRDMELDRRLGLDKYTTLVEKQDCSFLQKICRKVEYLLASQEQAKADVLWQYEYSDFLKQMRREDIMLSTGGDMMCYTDNEVIYTNDFARMKGGKTVLWGCSMGPENLTPAKESALRKFSLVYARESLTYEFFKELGLKNICLFPDPAFVLESEPCDLPECFAKGAVIGVNLSNYVLNGYSLDSAFGKEVSSLFEYILKETNLHVLLLPHVIWQDQDDRKVARMVMEHFGTTRRVSMLDIDNLNYCQIRNVIGKCRFFIGARTHAVISAYSMCVPTIALGYSIKSRGIAKDVGLEERLVVDSKKPESGRLVSVFDWLCRNEGTVSQHLSSAMPEYRQRAYGIMDVMSAEFAR